MPAGSHHVIPFLPLDCRLSQCLRTMLQSSIVVKEGRESRWGDVHMHWRTHELLWWSPFPDGGRLVSGFNDGVIRLGMCRPVHFWGHEGHHGRVTSVCILPAEHSLLQDHMTALSESGIRRLVCKVGEYAGHSHWFSISHSRRIASYSIGVVIVRSCVDYWCRSPFRKGAQRHLSCAVAGIYLPDRLAVGIDRRIHASRNWNQAPGSSTRHGKACYSLCHGAGREACSVLDSGRRADSVGPHIHGQSSGRSSLSIL